MARKNFSDIEKKKTEKSLIHSEANVENWPIFSLSKERRDVREYVRRIETEAGVERQAVKVSKSPYGHLSATDRRTFYGLIKIWSADRRESGEIDFSIYELLHILGMDTKVGGKNYRMVKDSIKRLAATMVEFHRAFVSKDKDGEAVIEELGLHLITEFHFIERKERGQQEFAAFNTIRLHPAILKNLEAFYTKQIDIGFAFSLGDVAMSLYLLLDMRTQGTKGAEFSIGLDKLAEQLNIRGRYPSDVKKVLDPAHQELQAAHYLKSARYRPGKAGEIVSYRIQGERRRKKTPAAAPSAEEQERSNLVALEHLRQIGLKLEE